METRISDLLSVIHYTIIKNHPSKSNTVILDELNSIDNKIKSGELEDYKVDDTAFFKSIINSYNKQS